MSLAQFIDHTVLKPLTSAKDIERLCAEAAEHGFKAVCVPPYYVSRAAELLKGGTAEVATVIGFPLGYSSPETKTFEAAEAVDNGATELDMVMNLAAFRNRDMASLEKEITAIAALARQNGALVKVIIESGLLSDEEIIACCDFYRNFDVAFLKTSTGFAEKGASVEAVRLMRRHLPSHIRIKASGGIRTYPFAKELIDAGATRLGCSASVEIVREDHR
ncbi:MAG TPA: deoxyribose-phosphate aldolase [Flavisolibacter sp.]|jgi:deoxyribose-phosphate aldolase